MAACLFVGCATSTSIRENGREVFRTTGNLTNVTFRTAQTAFHADSVQHDETTAASGTATAQTIGAVSGLVGTAATGAVAGIVAASHPVTAVLAPAVSTGVAHTTNASTNASAQKELTRRKLLRARPELRE